MGFKTARDRGIGDEQNTSALNKLEFYFTPQFSRLSALNAGLAYVYFSKAFYDEYVDSHLLHQAGGHIIADNVYNVTMF